MSDGRSLGEAATARSSAAKQAAQSAERELLVTIAAGSRSAMAELYFLYFARLWNFFLHVAGNADLVEGLISDTLIDVWRARARIESGTSVPAWIMSLAYSRGKMCLASAELVSPHLLPSAPRTEHDSALTTTSQNPWSLRDSLLTLPFEERAVLHLVYRGHHSRQSIADIMSTSCERVDVLLAQARHRLSYLKEETKGQQPCSRGR
jgi:DNA-directed RNA polymerase specialized sigma24 family protein